MSGITVYVPGFFIRACLASLLLYLRSMCIDASDGSQTGDTFITFHSAKKDFCASSQPSKAMTVRSKIDCASLCQRRTSCVCGNYRQQLKQCELYLYQPDKFEAQPGCVHLWVSTSFHFVCRKLKVQQLSCTSM
jgi:hypothetical protein